MLLLGNKTNNFTLWLQNNKSTWKKKGIFLNEWPCSFIKEIRSANLRNLSATFYLALISFEERKLWRKNRRGSQKYMVIESLRFFILNFSLTFILKFSKKLSFKITWWFIAWLTNPSSKYFSFPYPFHFLKQCKLK